MDTTDDKPDVIIDEVIIGIFDDTNYMLKGVKYIDQLLLGEERLECPVSFVTCESWTHVLEQWAENDGSMPWAIHPNVIQRLRDELAERDEARPPAALPWDDEDDEGWSLNLK